jgi:hypothetical protein
MTELPVWNYFYQLNTHKEQDGTLALRAILEKQGINRKDVFLGAVYMDKNNDKATYKILNFASNKTRTVSDYREFVKKLTVPKKIFLAVNFAMPVTDLRVNAIRISDEMLEKIYE